MSNQTGATGPSRRRFLGWSHAALAAIPGFSAFRAQVLDDAARRCGDRRTLPLRNPLASQHLKALAFICPAKDFHSELVK